MYSTPVNSLFENTMGYQFFDLLKNLEQKYGHSHFKSAFGINFGLWEVVKQKIHKYAYFQFDHFPKSKIDFESRFEKRMSIFLF